MSRRRRARVARGTAMRGLRTIANVRVAIALLFAVTLATPRAPLVYHTHAGGELAHVHADAGLLTLFGLGEPVAHRQAPNAAPDHRPAYARDSGAGGGHVHQQERYHSAVAAAAVFVAVSALLAALTPSVIQRASARTARTASARAPPRVVVG